MAQAWASPAVLTAGSQAAPKIPTSCRRSSDRSQTVVQLPACLAPQFEPHVVPSRRVPRLSSLALTRIRQRLLGCRIFTPAQPSHSAASSEGFLLRRLQPGVAFVVMQFTEPYLAIYEQVIKDAAESEQLGLSCRNSLWSGYTTRHYSWPRRGASCHRRGNSSQ